MARVKLLEVRCCCQPQKLLGWLPVPDARRKSVSFGAVVLPIDQINCEVAGVEVSYRAVKADGAPLDLLRGIPQFKEAPIEDEGA